MYAGRVASLRSRVLEIDAPIIPGESGGPVFDAVIGLAIPINRIKLFFRRAFLNLKEEN